MIVAAVGSLTGGVAFVSGPYSAGVGAGQGIVVGVPPSLTVGVALAVALVGRTVVVKSQFEEAGGWYRGQEPLTGAKVVDRVHWFGVWLAGREGEEQGLHLGCGPA